MVKSFDRLARSYALLERGTFGRQLERARFHHLSQLSSAQRILLLGEGDGRCLERLLALNPTAHIDVVERSGQMLAVAQARVGAIPRVHFYQEDACSFAPAQRYNALVTCFFLDCFEQSALQALVPRLAGLLQPGGFWLYSDFQEQPRGLAHYRNKLWLSLLYQAFAWLTDIRARTLVDPRPLFVDSGLLCQDSTSLCRGLLVSELWCKHQLRPDV
jgi:ubiquinone/menaquinone biosynthesis C-methylase UbiE